MNARRKFLSLLRYAPLVGGAALISKAAAADGFAGTGVTTGTWTPVIAGTSAAGVNTYSNQAAAWTRIGKVVFLWFTVQLSAKGTGGDAMSGTTLITGLPFTSTTAQPSKSLAIGGWGNVTLDAGFTQIALNIRVADGNTITVVEQGSAPAVQTNLPVANLSDTSFFNGTAVYPLP